MTRSGARRLDAVDKLRGLVISLMVLDHVRDFFHVSAHSFDPTDPAKTYPLLFVTRWITHLCAPTFVFLAGVSIFLQRANGKVGPDLTRFLLVRGIWLVILEATIVSFGFSFGFSLLFLQVIWAIGVSMIAMAALAHAKPAVVLALGTAILLLYPLVLPGPASDGIARILFILAAGAGPIPGHSIFVAYAILPWFSVMCLGFGIGPVFRFSSFARKRKLLFLATAFLTGFAVLRSINGYGDPRPWNDFPTAAQTAMSFLNLSKYPPSPDYVLATLGISFLLLSALESVRGWVGDALLAFGRTPLFTYLCHLYIAHGLMLAAALATGHRQVALHFLEQTFAGSTFPDWGWPLTVVYAVWLLVLAILLPLSQRMADLKRRRGYWVLSYI